MNELLQWAIVVVIVLFVFSRILKFFIKKPEQMGAQNEQLKKNKQQQIEKELIKDKVAEAQKAKGLPGRRDKKKAIDELKQLEGRDKKLEKEELKAA